MTDQDITACAPELLAAAKHLPPLRTAVVCAGAPVVMQSVRDATQEGLIEPILIGDPEQIKACAAKIDLDAEQFPIEPARDEESAALKAAAHVAKGQAGAILKGHIHTDTLMRTLLEKRFGLRTGRRLCHVFHITSPRRPKPLLLSDGALNTHPDLETKKQILQSAVDLAHAIGIARPKVAVLSATETPIEQIPSSVEARALREWAKKEVPEADVEGPLAFDVAFSPAAAAIKTIGGPVAGEADVLIVPDIVSGNALFKMMVHFMGACAAGIVLGAKVPILLTSRSDPPAARLASAALAVVAGHKLKPSGETG